MKVLGISSSSGFLPVPLGDYATTAWRRASACLFILVTAVAGCRNSGDAAERVHPVAHLMRPATDPAAVLDLRDLEADPPASTASRPLLGALNRPAGQTFGHIQDIVVGPMGDLFVLDDQAREVRRFSTRDPQGTPLTNQGNGPGSLSRPVRLALSGRERLLVFEAIGRVSVFSVRPDTARFLGSRLLQGPVFDGCALDDGFVVHGNQRADGNVLHTYSEEGERQRSFARLYPAGNWIVRYQVSQGLVACSGSAGLILYAAGMLPDLRAYSPSGELVWWIRVDGFHGMPLVETPTGSIMRFEGSDYHVMASLVAARDTPWAALQIGVVTPESRRHRAVARLHTYLIDLRAPAIRYVGTRFPRLVDMSGTELIAVSDDPFPRALSYPSNALPED